MHDNLAPLARAARVRERFRLTVVSCRLVNVRGTASAGSPFRPTVEDRPGSLVGVWTSFGLHPQSHGDVPMICCKCHARCHQKKNLIDSNFQTYSNAKKSQKKIKPKTKTTLRSSKFLSERKQSSPTTAHPYQQQQDTQK